jgi:hypothetical protein
MKSIQILKNWILIKVKFKLQKCAACQDLPTLQFWSKSHFRVISLFSSNFQNFNTFRQLDTLVMIQTKFGFNWSSSFRGEDFWKSLRRTTDGRRTPSDGNSSYGPKGPGELKTLPAMFSNINTRNGMTDFLKFVGPSRQKITRTGNTAKYAGPGVRQKVLFVPPCFQI